MSLVVPTSADIALSNYGELVDAVSAFLDREDLVARIPVYVRLVEGLINRELRSTDMEQITYLTLTSGSTALPIDFLEARRVACGTQILDYVSPIRMLDLRHRNQVEVKHYSIVGETIQTPPLSSDEINLLYYARVETLRNDAPTNWILSRHPDVYFTGCMFYATADHDDKESAAAWKMLFNEAVAGLQRHSNSKRFSGPMVPEGAVQVAGSRI